jgi:CBS domain-containing protein
MPGTLVSRVMSSPAHTVRVDASLWIAVGLLESYQVSGLPVVDRDGTLVGVLSEKDVLRKLDQTAPRADPTMGARSLSLPAGAGEARRFECYRERLERLAVRETMTARAVTVCAESSVAEAAAKMRRFGVNRPPVVDGETLVGIVTRHDVLPTDLGERGP